MRKPTLAIIAIILLLVAALASYAGYLLYAASQVYVSEMSITGLQDTPQGLSFNGELKVTNPSGTDVLLEELRYRIVLENTGEEIARGVIPGSTIPANGMAALQVRQQTTWRPSMDAAISMARDPAIYLTFSGTAVVSVIGIPVSGPFSERVDVKETVADWLAEKRQEITKDPRSVLRQRGRTVS